MSGIQAILTALQERPQEVAPFLVLMFPLVGFVVLSLFGDAIRREGKSDAAGWIASAMAVLAFTCATFAVRGLLGMPMPMPPHVEGVTLQEHAMALRAVLPSLGFDFIAVGALAVPMSLLLDPLSAVMILTVSGIGALIHIYSIGYMAHDEDRVRFFSYLNLFLFFMLLLVLGGSLPLLFIGWEGVGLCSYFLIGFWYKKKSASDAGLKAFVVNRIGDAGLILGMILAFHALGTVDLFELAEAAASRPVETAAPGVITAICLLLFVGACGKSAQIPLHVWLPDAMEGPTPVSALIHAATMVTAGVYMVCRLSPLYLKAPTAMEVVAIVGITTAVTAATIALVQTDIKRVLAYSTVSQLGYMFVAAGVGAFGVAIFHLFTHAFFKALLFLGSGSVIHALSGEQDMRKMGGLRSKIPWTYWTFVAGTLAIAGIPPLSGFYSKDAILGAALGGGHTALFVLGAITAAMTSFYMARLLFLTFFGTYRGAAEGGDAHAVDHGHADDHGHGHGGHGGVHESPWSMLGPLVILAIGAVGVGLLEHGFLHFLQPAFRVEWELPHISWLPYFATGVAVTGIGVAAYLYLVAVGLSGRIYAMFAPLSAALEAKWGFDIVFNWFASRVVVDGSRAGLWKVVDATIIDGAINGSASLVGGIAEGARALQTGLVRAYVLMILGGAVGVFGYLLWR